MGLELQAACFRAEVYLYCQPPALSWFESSGATVTVILLITSNYTGTTSDEQDEFTMSLWSCHCQTPHGKLVFVFVG